MALSALWAWDAFSRRWVHRDPHTRSVQGQEQTMGVGCLFHALGSQRPSYEVSTGPGADHGRGMPFPRVGFTETLIRCPSKARKELIKVGKKVRKRGARRNSCVVETIQWLTWFLI